MKIKELNIGLAIEQKLNELGVSKSAFGRMIGIPQQNVNRILTKNSIDTEKLASICEALNYNFFADYIDASQTVHTEGDYSPASVSGNIAVGNDAVLEERCKQLEKMIADKDEQIKFLRGLLENRDRK